MLICRQYAHSNLSLSLDLSVVAAVVIVIASAVLAAVVSAVVAVIADTPQHNITISILLRRSKPV